HSATGAWSQEISLLSSSRSPHSMTMAHTSPLALWKWLHGTAHHLEKRWDTWRFQRRRRLGRIESVHIVPFLGYGNASKAVLGGRVLEKKPLGRPHEDTPWWENVRAMIQRWASAEIPHVRLAARCNGQVLETTTDEEGYFTVEFALQERPVRGPGWHQVEIELLDAVVPGQEAVTATGQILIPPAQPDFMIVSDIDDTILKTYATDFFRMVRVTLLNNVHTRIPFAGVSAFYQALHQGPHGTSQNPLFYISSSAWNLYDLLLDFLDLHQIPRGPLLLRDLGIDESQFIKTGHEHKLEKLEQLLHFYPASRFILIGDSGQHDPRLYTEAVRRYPGRILAIYIRDVHPVNRASTVAYARQAEALGTPLRLVSDTVEAAQHAAQQGLIRWPEVPSVRQKQVEAR
ncbi:MAG TPA: phosphatase domain-containing protein, partial [Candidatus Competibacteraceae bacterium]|nr:phosphatase domain-containing protein [Candidatus Competibacteraceae bacterium]